MQLEIVKLTLGPVRTNCYLVGNQEGVAAVIDPAWDGHIILEEANKRGWRIAHLWYTHAHFDHIGGAGVIADALNPLPLVALHPADHDLWKIGGGGAKFGFTIDPGPEPTIDFYDHQILHLGHTMIEVLYTPGHTPGHCVFYSKQAGVCFCGDLIFSGSVGRTDLPGSSWDDLEKSIRTKIYTLPVETRLLSGHGNESTVGSEKLTNPYVKNDD
ncbi:MAG: MBL fold metallo-hydrolase [Chloroflexota bacterium]